MPIPTNDAFSVADDLVNYEISIDELEAIAAGSLLGDILNFVGKEVQSVGNFFVRHPWAAGNVTNQVAWVGRHIF
jgi:hypothetical protein